jgi:hypothetical protein
LKNFSALYGRRLNHWSKPEQHVLHQRALYSSFKLVSHISQSRLFAVTSVLSKISLRRGMVVNDICYNFPFELGTCRTIYGPTVFEVANALRPMKLGTAVPKKA